jgi:hypothetical protein
MYFFLRSVYHDNGDLNKYKIEALLSTLIMHVQSHELQSQMLNLFYSDLLYSSFLYDATS